MTSWRQWNGFSFSIAAHRSRAPPAPRRVPAALPAIQEMSGTAQTPAHQEEGSALQEAAIEGAIDAALPSVDESTASSGEMDGQLQPAALPSALLSTTSGPVLDSTEESSAHEQPAQELPTLGCLCSA